MYAVAETMRGRSIDVMGVKVGLERCQDPGDVAGTGPRLFHRTVGFAQDKFMVYLWNAVFRSIVVPWGLLKAQMKGQGGADGQDKCNTNVTMLRGLLRDGSRSGAEEGWRLTIP